MSDLSSISTTISPAVALGDGVLTHCVTSPWQAGQTAIHVLRPDRGATNAGTKTLYLLPVEPHEGRQCGDPMDEIRIQSQNFCAVGNRLNQLGGADLPSR